MERPASSSAESKRRGDTSLHSQYFFGNNRIASAALIPCEIFSAIFFGRKLRKRGATGVNSDACVTSVDVSLPCSIWRIPTCSRGFGPFKLENTHLHYSLHYQYQVIIPRAQKSARKTNSPSEWRPSRQRSPGRPNTAAKSSQTPPRPSGPTGHARMNHHAQ